MKDLFQTLRKFLAERVRLDEREVALFIDAADIVHIKRKEFFVTQGKPAAYKGFLNNGCVRTFFSDEKGKDNILFFSFEGAWLGDVESYHLNRPSRVSIQAMEDCEMLVVTRANFEKLEQDIPKLQKWYNYTAVKMYSALFDKLIESKIRNVEDRYNYLLLEHPNIFQRIPLKNIAEYLEIEAPSLSRLRKRITVKGR